MDGRTCRACGASCADGARFCSQCAAPLDAAQPDHLRTMYYRLFSEYAHLPVVDVAYVAHVV